MIKDILKMGGCKTEAEFYAKYPTEESFFEAFPQARPMMEQFAKGGDLEAFPQTRPMFVKGGGLDIEAFPGAADNISNYGGKTLIPPYIFQYGGMMQNQNMAFGEQDDQQESPQYNQQSSQQEDPLISVVTIVSQQYNMDPKEVIGLIQKLPQDMVEKLYVLASNDPNQAAQRVADMVSKNRMDPVKMIAKKGGSFDTPPTADQFFHQYPDVNFPIAMAQIGGSMPMLNMQSEAPTGNVFDEYGGSVFNYGQFPAIMKKGGVSPMNQQDTYVPDRLKSFLDKLHGYANKYMAEQGIPPVQQEQPMMPPQMAKIGGPRLTKHQVPPGQHKYFEPDIAKMPGSSFFDMNMNASSDESTNTGGFINMNDSPPAYDDDITKMPGSFKTDTMTSSDMADDKQYGFKMDYSDKGKRISQDEVDKGDNIKQSRLSRAAKNVGNWWSNQTGVQKAETILNTLSGFNDALEKRRMNKRQEQIDEELYNPMNWAGSYQAEKGDWDQFGNFRPNNTVPTQFTGLAAYGGQLPVAQSGLEIKMKAGLGFNANQLSWPVMAGEFSQPDVEVKGTLQPVDRDDANLEAEVGETAVTNLTGDGIPEQYKIGGKRHYDGGTPLNLPDNSFIFSRDKSMKIKDREVLAQFGITSVPKGGMTPADIAKRYDLNKYKKVLLDSNSDELARDTAQANIENANLKLGKLALIQESMKAFPDGIPMISTPYLDSVGINPDMLPVNPQEELNEEEQPDADNQARYGSNVVAQFNTKRGGGRILPKHQVPPGQSGSPWAFSNNSNQKAAQQPKKQLTPVEQALKDSGELTYWNLDDTDFVDPSKPEYAIGMPFLAIMNYNKADSINNRKTYYNPLTAKIESADFNKNGLIDKDEWEKITTAMVDYKDKLNDVSIPGSYSTGIGPFISMFRTDVRGFTNQDKLDDIADVLENKASDFQNRYSVLLDMDFNKNQIKKAQDNLTMYQKQLNEHLKKGNDTERLTNPDFYLTQLEYEKNIGYLKNYIDLANKSLEKEENMFIDVYPVGMGGGSIVYKGGSTTRIPDYATAYEKELKKLAKDQEPALAKSIDDNLKNSKTAAVVLDQNMVTQEKTDIPPAPAPKKNPPAKTPAPAATNKPAAGRMSIQEAKQTLANMGYYNGVADSVPDAQAQKYIESVSKKFGGDLRKFQGTTGGSQWSADVQDKGYLQPLLDKGYTQKRPAAWDPQRDIVSEQTTNTGWSISPEGVYYKPGVFDPKIDQLKDNPNVDWSQYQGGWDQWKKDMASSKGRSSKASTFYNDQNQSAYTRLDPNSKYTVIGDRSKKNRRGDIIGDIPGYEWFTQPWLTKNPDVPNTEQPCPPCNGVVPQKVNGVCPPCSPGDIPVNDKKIEEASYDGVTPFWTQDIINTGAAFRNLADIKKYLPWQAKAPFYAAEPTFESPERALAANFESLAQGVQGISNFADPQAFAGSFSGMAGKAGANAANIIADVWNRNVQTDNQFELANKQAYNQYLQGQADRATNMYDKTTIANQQYDNAKKEARNELRSQFVNAWTNRGMTDTINRMYSDQYRVDPITSSTYFTKGRDFEAKVPTVDQMPDEVKNVYNQLKGLGTAEGLQKAAKVYFDWLENQGYGGKNKGKKTNEGDQMLMNLYAAMAGRWQ